MKCESCDKKISKPKKTNQNLTAWFLCNICRKDKFSFPLPEITKIKQIVHHDRESFVFISRDPNAGRKNVYSVIRIFYKKYVPRCIGRELPLKIARMVAKRNSNEDGTPL